MPISARNIALAAGASALGVAGYLHFRKSAPVLDSSLLAKSDASTTAAIIEAFKDNAKFATLSTAEMTDILARDKEDGDKLAAGVKLAVDKGVLAQDPLVEPTIKINVLGKTPDQVSREIIAKLPSSGCVMILQGLSGTGKGTTVECLEKQLPDAVTWSNGNVFRSITLLALTMRAERCAI
jgi:cytidylate kinase